MATVLAVVMCRGCKVQVFDDGSILRLEEPIAVQQSPYDVTYGDGATKIRCNGTTWADVWQNGPLVGWDPLR